MIWDGAQYPPHISEGIRGISRHDTIEIIFSFWHDTLYPGDSVIVQLMVYDEDDSLNTVHHLTFIQHCPLQTSTAHPATENLLDIFPNPVIDEVNIKIPEELSASSLFLYTITGEVIRKWSNPGNEIKLSLDGLPEGMYFIGAVSHNRIIGINRIIKMK